MDGASPLPDFEVTTAIGNDAVSLAVGGDVDLAAVPGLAARLDQAISTNGHKVVVDLGDVTFMDCAGLTLLIAARRRLAIDERRLVLARPSPCVRRLFDLAGVNLLVDVDDDDRDSR
jgi:anti-sigma B factor antagonist